MSLDTVLIGIAAVAQNGVIGVREANDMPWRLGAYASDPFWNNMSDKSSFRPQDMQHFKDITSGHTVIMGRETKDSLGKYFPLANRYNLVMSRTQTGSDEGYTFHNSKQEVLDSLAKREDKVAFVMGGQAIYEAFIPEMNGLLITRLHKDFAGDVYFPEISSDDWALVSKPPLGTIDPRLASLEHYVSMH